MKRNEMTEILGYEPSRGQRLEILKIVKAEGISIQEATARFQLPAMFVKKNGLIEVDGQLMTPVEFQEKHPYRKFVTIARRSDNENNI